MSKPMVSLTTCGSVAWIRLNRPESMNSLCTPLLEELDQSIDFAQQNPNVRAVVLIGSGKAFCAGADLKELLDANGSMNQKNLLSVVARIAYSIERISTLTIPVIAALNGLALAGGLELAMACDIVLAAESARIGDAHSNYGLLPGAGGAARLSRIVGRSRAKYLAFTGSFLPAADLVSCGLVQEVVSDDQLERRAGELARLIASKSGSGLAHMKRLIDDGLETSLDEALHMELEVLAVHARSEDMLEGLKAFQEKRRPRFS